VWQAAGTTGGFVAGLGAAGYATRRDLSSWYRVLFWALLGLIVFGLVALFVSIPNENIIWSVAGLVIFGGYTVLDFNRLAALGPRGGGADRGEHLPECPEHLSVLPSAVRRKQRVTRRSL
jgi:FtsH-binding integral membrane protein